MSMKTFSDFVKNKPKESWLNFDGSFAAIRKKSKESILSWPSSHGEIRKDSKKPIKEDIIAPPSDALKHTHQIANNDTYHFFDAIHAHPDIIPQKLSQTHIQSIIDYTHTTSDDPDGDGSSKNINGYFRNRASADPNTEHKVLFHHPDDVKYRAKQLISAFTPENTNRKPIQVFSGIPPSIGKKLMDSKPGDRHTLAGATSTSTSRDTARGFGIDHARNERASIDHPHLMVCHVEPGAGLSLAHHSRFEENEVLLHPGAHVTYRGSEVTDDGEHLHHVTVHNTHKPLDEYPEYKV